MSKLLNESVSLARQLSNQYVSLLRSHRNVNSIEREFEALTEPFGLERPTLPLFPGVRPVFRPDSHAGSDAGSRAPLIDLLRAALDGAKSGPLDGATFQRECDDFERCVADWCGSQKPGQLGELFALIRQLTERVSVLGQLCYGAETTTEEHGVQVRIQTSPMLYADNRLFSFSYDISIRNLVERPAPIQLLYRHWIFRNAVGVEEEITGEGVVGQQPKFQSDAHQFNYRSHVQLTTPFGDMRGAFFFAASEPEPIRVSVGPVGLINERIEFDVEESSDKE